MPAAGVAPSYTHHRKQQVCPPDTPRQTEIPVAERLAQGIIGDAAMTDVFSTKARELGQAISNELADRLADGLMDGDDLHTGDVFPLQ